MIGLQDVIAERHKIAGQRQALDQRDADLAVTERVLRALGGEAPFSAPRPGRKPSPDGLPRQWATVLSLVGDGVERDDLLQRINEERAEPLSAASFSAVLSKMATAGHIRRVGSNVFPAKKAEGDADVS